MTAAARITRNIPELEGLRGIVASYVAIHHSLGNVPSIHSHPALFPLRFGIEAVLIFFVLSGFVISYSTEKSKSIDWRIYCGLRLRRIFPIFLLALGLSYIAQAYAMGRVVPVDWKNLLGNLLMMQDVNKPGIWVDPFCGNGPLWSLSYEMWFYGLYAVIMMWVPSPRQLWATGALSVLAIGVASLFPNPISNFCALLPIWWTGVEMARRVARGDGLGLRSMAPVYGLLALPTLWFALRCYMHATDPAAGPRYLAAHPYVELRMYLFCIACCLGLPLLLKIKPCVACLNWRPFQWLGGISYAIYLFHIPIIKWDIGVMPIWASFGIKLAVILALAWLAEACLQPWINRKTNHLLRPARHLSATNAR